MLRDGVRYGVCRRCCPDLVQAGYRRGIAETIFYFSGVSGPDELSMLKEAGVSHILVDQFDYPHVRRGRWLGSLALDSGAYRMFKKGRKLDVEAYLELAASHGDRFDFVMAPDVIGESWASYRN